METELKSGRTCILGAWNFIKGDPRMFVVVRQKDQDSVVVKIHAKFKPLMEFAYPLASLQPSDISITLDDAICAKIASTVPD